MAVVGEAKVGRKELVEECGLMGVLDGWWKYIEPTKGPKTNVRTHTESGNSSEPQVYDLGADLGETNNLGQAQANKTQRLREELKAEREKRALIAKSEGQRQEEINLADGEKQAFILKSEGAKQHASNNTPGDAQALELIAQATANAVRIVAEVLSKPGGMSATNHKDA